MSVIIQDEKYWDPRFKGSEVKFVIVCQKDHADGRGYTSSILGYRTYSDAEGDFAYQTYTNGPGKLYAVCKPEENWNCDFCGQDCGDNLVVARGGQYCATCDKEHKEDYAEPAPEPVRKPKRVIKLRKSSK
jgi:hypothetical protein